jgi:hypothetical protein
MLIIAKRIRTGQRMWQDKYLVEWKGRSGMDSIWSFKREEAKAFTLAEWEIIKPQTHSGVKCVPIGVGA